MIQNDMLLLRLVLGSGCCEEAAHPGFEGGRNALSRPRPSFEGAQIRNSLKLALSRLTHLLWFAL